MVATRMVITISVFVLQQVMNAFFPDAGGRENSFLTEWFALSGQNFRELKVWTILSYGLLHSSAGFYHILGNMLGLFFIGRMVEPLIGREHFLGLYVTGTLIGGAVWLLLNFYGSSVIGASASVMAILAFFCLLYPERPITLLLFFIIPVTMKPKWIFWSMLAISTGGILLYALPNKGKLAHSAHLGGIFAGILYYRYFHNRSFSVCGSDSTQTTVEQPAWFKRRKKNKQHISYKVNRIKRNELQIEVDRILDKINATGFGSLTDSEKQTLDRAKDILSR